MTIEVTPPARDTAPDREGACEECGFNAEALTAADLVAALRTAGDAYRWALGVADGGEVSTSAIRIAAQVRDVLHVVRSRVRRLGHPAGIVTLPEMIEISLTSADDQPPPLVADGLARNADGLARTLGELSGDGWLRVGLRNGVRVRPIDLAREAVHECRHGLALIDEIRRQPSP